MFNTDDIVSLLRVRAHLRQPVVFYTSLRIVAKGRDRVHFARFKHTSHPISSATTWLPSCRWAPVLPSVCSLAWQIGCVRLLFDECRGARLELVIVCSAPHKGKCRASMFFFTDVRASVEVFTALPAGLYSCTPRTTMRRVFLALPETFPFLPQIGWDLSGSCLQSDLLGPGNVQSAEVRYQARTSQKQRPWCRDDAAATLAIIRSKRRGGAYDRNWAAFIHDFDDLEYHAPVGSC